MLMSSDHPPLSSVEEQRRFANNHQKYKVWYFFLLEVQLDHKLWVLFSKTCLELSLVQKAVWSQMSWRITVKNKTNALHPQWLVLTLVCSSTSQNYKTHPLLTRHCCYSCSSTEKMMDFIQLAEGENKLILDSTSAFVCGPEQIWQKSKRLDNWDFWFRFLGDKKKGVNVFLSM